MNEEIIFHIMHIIHIYHISTLIKLSFKSEKHEIKWFDKNIPFMPAGFA